MSYFKKIKETRIFAPCFTLYVTFHKMKIPLTSKFFFMIIHEDSKKSYPSVVAYHQMILEYSIIMHQIIHSFETDISDC